MAKRGSPYVAGKVVLSDTNLRSRSLAIDVLRLLGHTKRGAAAKVAHLDFPEE